MSDDEVPDVRARWEPRSPVLRYLVGLYEQPGGYQLARWLILRLLGYANLPMLLALWAVYGSFVRVGELWFSFGWEIQILETTLIAAVMAHPWDPRPLKAPPPPGPSIVLMKWLAFRIMLGAGLI